MEKLTDNVDGLIGKATNLMKNHQYKDAIEKLEESLYIDPSNTHALEQVVVCNLELKQPKKAMEALNLLTGVNPNCHKFWGDKGYLHLLLNEITEGIGALKESLKIDSKNSYNWELLGSAYMANDEWTLALEALLSGINVNPNSGIAWYNLAICFFMLDQYQDAIESAEYAFAINPSLQELASEWIDVLRDALDYDDSDVDDEMIDAS